MNFWGHNEPASKLWVGVLSGQDLDQNGLGLVSPVEERDGVWYPKWEALPLLWDWIWLCPSRSCGVWFWHSGVFLSGKGYELYPKEPFLSPVKEKAFDLLSLYLIIYCECTDFNSIWSRFVMLSLNVPLSYEIHILPSCPLGWCCLLYMVFRRSGTDTGPYWLFMLLFTLQFTCIDNIFKVFISICALFIRTKIWKFFTPADP